MGYSEEKPEIKIRSMMINDINFIIAMMNTIIPANDIDKNKLLIGESMLLQLKEQLENAQTGAELSQILDVMAIREDWPILEQKLSDKMLSKEVLAWKNRIMKGD